MGAKCNSACWSSNCSCWGRSTFRTACRNNGWRRGRHVLGFQRMGDGVIHALVTDVANDTRHRESVV
jgi:hypothetical protein